MSTNNLSIPLDKWINEDSLISNSTSISYNESITQDIAKNKNVYLITKSIEQRITDILSFLQSDSNLATSKIQVIKYLQSLFINVEFNSEIFLRNYINEKEKLNLYKIIIYQYIFYTNPGNSKSDEENYRDDLQNLFLLLLSQVTLEKETYHYILSSMIYLINEKNGTTLSKKNSTGNDFVENDPIINFKPIHLNRMLLLLKYFYGYHKNEQSSNGILNYFFFSGDPDTSIIIPNKENRSSPNKKLLNLDETLCIMMFIKVLPPEYIKAVHNKINCKLIEIKFSEKDKSICINMDIDNQITTSLSKEPLYTLLPNETYCLIFKFNRKKQTINCELHTDFNKIELPPFQMEFEKDKNNKIKEEIKEIELFKNFIGTCCNIIIYKEKKNEGMPKFLFPGENKFKTQSKDNNSVRRSSIWNNSLFPNGIYNEELYSYFAKAELKEKDQIEDSTNKNNSLINEQKINYNAFKDFLTNNMIAIYIPTRHIIQNQVEEKSISNNSQLILIDSINGLNAEFNTKSPSLNGVHIFKNLYENDLNIIGGINNLLPILEFMLDNEEFLTINNFSSFFNLLTVYVFSPKYQNALMKEDQSNFFQCLSFFLERIPDIFFNDELAENFKTILGFLSPINEEKNLEQLNNNFHNYILMNEKILLKFNEDNQKLLINLICTTAGRNNLEIDIIKIIRIILYYDRNRKYKFCCKEHAQYFNENCSVMDPDLYTRLQPVMNLIKIIFYKTYKKGMENYNDIMASGLNKEKIRKKTSSKNLNKIDENKIIEDNNLFLFFYLLSYNISPCLQKSMIELFDSLIKEISMDKFWMIFDKKRELLDIILFVFKTSIFDIKINALNLVLLIDKENGWNYLGNTEIKIFIQNEILPLFLLDEVCSLPTKKNESQDELKNEINIENDKTKEEKKDNEEKIEKININDVNEINMDEDKDEYGIRNNIEIKGVKYDLFLVSETEKKINKKYNKKKFHYLVNVTYNRVFSYLDNPDKIFNLLIKIVSKGDLLLISSFISKMKNILEEPDESKNNLLYSEIMNSIYFFQFILDTYIQLYILVKNKDKTKSFVPGFSLDIYKNTLETVEIPYDENEKKEIINKAYTECEKILEFIVFKDITKFDYILTWGKYYEEIEKENEIYQCVYEVIDGLINKLLGSKEVTTFNERSDVNDPIVQTTLYYVNILFEFLTFYNINNKSILQKDPKKMNEIIKNKFKYVFYKQKQGNSDLTPTEELETAFNKIDNLVFVQVSFMILKPIWEGSNDKLLKSENEVYSKFICDSVNKNSYINELKILFSTFNFLGKNINDICNKGMKMIYIIYHFCISFLNVGGNLSDLKTYFQDLRLYLLLLITSSSTINITESIKKKKWPNEEQNEEIKQTIEYILFNSIFFFYNKIKDFKLKEKDYNLKIEKEKGDESKKDEIENYQKNLESLSVLKKLYIENLGYFLKVLNLVYRGVTSSENQPKKGFTLFKNKNKIAERIKLSGAFAFIDYLYKECFISEEIKNLNNNTQKPKKKELYKKFTIEERHITLNNEQKKDSEESNVKLNKSHSQKNNTDSINVSPTENSDENNTNSDNNLNQKDKNENENKKEDNDMKVNNQNINNNNPNADNNDKNYLDDILKINFSPKDAKEISISDEDYQILENLINLFLEDQKVQKFFEKYNEKHIIDLYPFISTIKERQLKIRTIIPIYDNRKNLRNFPYDLCLVPYYYAESKYSNIMLGKIEKMSKNLREELRLSKKIMEIEDRIKEEEYRSDKKKMFKFRGVWSYEDIFYDIKKYKLKYKLLDHYTNDLTKIFMTPITDIDYYLPKFSKFNGQIFRKELSEANLIPVTKIVDICFPKLKKKNDEKQKNENKSENNNNSSMISFDSLNYSTLSNLNESKQDSMNLTMSPLYELNQEYYSFLREQEIKEAKETENLINNFNQKDFDIFTKLIEKKHLINKGHCLQCEACLVRLSFHIKGVIYVNYKEIGFYSYETKRTGEEEDYDSDKKICFGSVFREKSDKYNNYYLKIPFQKIEFMFKRRYYFKRNVLEIFTQNKKSYFFRINDKEFDNFFQCIIQNNLKSKYNIELEDITIENSKNEEKIGLINKSNALYEYNNYKTLFYSKRSTTIKNLYNKWIKWEISTFTLLNYLNLFSSRSYNDVNQYPVFPWIITEYTKTSPPDLTSDSNPTLTNSSDYVPMIRPFNCPMGMIDITEESRERKENYIMHFTSTDKDPDENFDRYGSHYSTSLYLTYYLVRVFPFSYLRIEIQGKNFDDPNRLFSALDNSFKNAISTKSDLRELIPEFFCLPEMFYNMNDLNLGEVVDEQTKLKKLVNNIKMPPWASNDAYIFIKYHREMLESIEVSEKIHEWFNIIFGSKQKGKAAKKINNLFIKQTYDDFDEVYKNSSLSDKIYQKRMVEFGVTPSQVFKNDVDKRLAVKNLGKKPILFDYQISKGKKEINELKIKESEIYVEGEPYKIFSSWKKDEEQKFEKLMFLYRDKVKIISKSDKGFFKKNKSNKSHKENKNKEKSEQKKDDKEKEKKEDNKDIKEENKDNENNEENKEDMDKNEINDKDNSIESNEQETKEGDINEITSLNKDISKYDRIIISPKYRMDPSQSPSIIYDNGNYIILGGFWNGQIIINKLEESDKNKKNKSQKICNIISTNIMSPITNMKLDESETWLICSNNLGYIFIFSNKNERKNKMEWILTKTIQDSQSEITSLDFNENLNIFISSDKEGYINLYTFPKCKLFNSYKLNESQFSSNNNLYDNSSFQNSESNINNIYSSQNNIYANKVIISHSPLPCIIIYIPSKKCLCVYSINFHFIKDKYGIEIEPNDIKKYTDYFRKDYLFIYNKKEKTIDIYDTINLDIILRSSKFDYTFIDFYFSKEMEVALIMVKIEDEEKIENTKDRNMKKNYKILMLNTPGKGENES